MNATKILVSTALRFFSGMVGTQHDLGRKGPTVKIAGNLEAQNLQHRGLVVATDERQDALILETINQRTGGLDECVLQADEVLE